MHKIMKKKISVHKYVIYFCCALLSCSSWSVLAQTAWVEDNNFNACLQSIAKKKGWKSAASFTEVKCHNQDIVSVAGLEKFINLAKLSLYNNDIENINLAPFPHLRQINIAKNKLKTLSLENKQFVEYLYLFGNELDSVQLRNLPMLSQLKANSNNIEQFSYQQLPQLEKVYLFDNKMETIDIHNLPNLKYMDVRQNPMSDELYEDMDKKVGVTIWHDGNADDWN